MAKDFLYINGVIAASEKYLLKDRILKLCEVGAEEALRTVTECGFGSGAEISSVYDYEGLVAADEADIDAFIREYAPSAAEAAYLLAPRDFHNAKAAVKARYTGASVEGLLAPQGLIPVDVILGAVKEGDFRPLGKILGGAVRAAVDLLSEENAAHSGAETGIIFERAQLEYLFGACARNKLLKKLLQDKADMTNILTALRAGEPEYAEKCFVPGGRLTVKQLLGLFGENREGALDGTQYSEFVKKCFADKSAGLPLTAAERLFESYEGQYLAANRYELQKNEPFLYYVFRRRAENANVRILFVCLLAGMKEGEIKKRLRIF